MNVKSKFDLHGIRSRRVLVFVSLLFIIVLCSFCIFFVFGDSSSSGVLVSVVVSDEVELRNAVDTASGFTVIAFDKDIVLTSSALTISAGKNITLTSVSNSEIFKLVGANNVYTIAVEDGVLNLEGIVVTHISGDYGGGVYNRGTLSMFGGEISGNTAGDGGGVYNQGTFKMSGGKISGNTAILDAIYCSGGGVYNAGSFVMYSGVISDNTASSNGGGVYNNYASFSMFGGVISGNIATNGGGVFNFRGNFDLCDGVIFGNNAVEQGGGVYSYTAGSGNGILNGSTGSFNVSGGEIYGNTVTNKNGNADVYNWTTW